MIEKFTAIEQCFVVELAGARFKYQIEHAALPPTQVKARRWTDRDEAPACIKVETVFGFYRADELIGAARIQRFKIDGLCETDELPVLLDPFSQQAHDLGSLICERWREAGDDLHAYGDIVLFDRLQILQGAYPHAEWGEVTERILASDYCRGDGASALFLKPKPFTPPSVEMARKRFLSRRAALVRLYEQKLKVQTFSFDREPWQIRSLTPRVSTAEFLRMIGRKAKRPRKTTRNADVSDGFP